MGFNLEALRKAREFRPRSSGEAWHQIQQLRIFSDSASRAALHAEKYFIQNCRDYYAERYGAPTTTEMAILRERLITYSSPTRVAELEESIKALATEMKAPSIGHSRG